MLSTDMEIYLNSLKNVYNFYFTSLDRVKKDIGSSLLRFVWIKMLFFYLPFAYRNVLVLIRLGVCIIYVNYLT
jgi:hypothetical protein